MTFYFNAHIFLYMYYNFGAAPGYTLRCRTVIYIMVRVINKYINKIWHLCTPEYFK